MSADLLRRAAERLEELAANTSAGPWQLIGDWGIPNGWTAVWSAGVGQYVAENPGSTVSRPDVQWIATLGPQIAAPLAAWLRAEAQYMKDERDDSSDSAVQLARAILKETP